MTPALLPREFRVWVAENLIRGADPAQLHAVLQAQGFSEAAIRAELDDAQQHPYVQAGRRTGTAAAKREWHMATRATLRKLDSSPLTVERVPIPALSEFERRWYAHNTPVVLTGAVDHWPALSKWSLGYLKAQAGGAPLELQQGREDDPLFDIHHGAHTTHTTLGAFVDRLSATEASNDLYVTARNAQANAEHLSALWQDLADIGDGYLNMSAPHARPHLWLGPKGTETPLHHDLNNILFVQLVGRKKFTLIPPDQTPWLYNFHTVYSAVDPERPDLSRFPDYANATPAVVELGPGDVLFIPVGWWHSVVSLDVSMSVGFVHLQLDNEFHHSYAHAVRDEQAQGPRDYRR